ncbi:hypothetical protein SEA_WALTZ_20 [Arthrobacter phage Waltz]|nr:hypothetical protein SEA_WALTZ_20 [Arthrobacter phage Waltz]
MAECQKTREKCVCAKSPDHRGKHQCMCGQTWMGKSGETSPAEHDLMADLKNVTEAEGEKLEEMKEVQQALCASIRELFGVDHKVAHEAIRGFMFTAQHNADKQGVTVDAFIADLSAVERAMLIGACVGATMTVSGHVGLVVEGEDDGE